MAYDHCVIIVVLMHIRELAEILGQVKPPIATKDEIERSGLEVLKAKDLPQFVEANKVASNTTERVSIHFSHIA